eukprot:RCo052037
MLRKISVPHGFRSALSIRTDGELLEYSTAAYHGLLRAQARVRGALARKRVLNLLDSMDDLECRDDSRWRLEYIAATHIQRRWRGVLARQRARLLLKQLAADKVLQQRFLRSLSAAERQLQAFRLHPAPQVAVGPLPPMHSMEETKAQQRAQLRADIWNRQWRARQKASTTVMSSSGGADVPPGSDPSYWTRNGAEQIFPNSMARGVDSRRWIVEMEEEALRQIQPPSSEAELYLRQLRERQKAMEEEKFLVRENARLLAQAKRNREQSQHMAKQIAQVLWSEEVVRREITDAFHDFITMVSKAKKEDHERALQRELRRADDVRLRRVHQLQSDFTAVTGAMHRIERESLEEDEGMAREALSKRLLQEFQEGLGELQTKMQHARQELLSREALQLQEEERAFQRELQKLEFNQRAMAFEAFLAEQRKKAAVSINRMLVVLQNQLKDLQELETVQRGLIEQTARSAWDALRLAHAQGLLQASRTAEAEVVQRRLAGVQAEVEFLRKQLEDNAIRDREQRAGRVRLRRYYGDQTLPMDTAAALLEDESAASRYLDPAGFVAQAQAELYRWVPLLQVMDEASSTAATSTSALDGEAAVEAPAMGGFPNPTLSLVVSALETAVTGRVLSEDDADEDMLEGYLSTPRARAFEELGKVIALELVECPGLPVRPLLRELARRLAMNTMQRAQDQGGFKRAEVLLRRKEKQAQMEARILAQVGTEPEMPLYALDMLRQTETPYLAGLDVLVGIVQGQTAAAASSAEAMEAEATQASLADTAHSMGFPAMSTLLDAAGPSEELAPAFPSLKCLVDVAGMKKVPSRGAFEDTSPPIESSIDGAFEVEEKQERRSIMDALTTTIKELPGLSGDLLNPLLAPTTVSSRREEPTPPPLQPPRQSISGPPPATSARPGATSARVPAPAQPPTDTTEAPAPAPAPTSEPQAQASAAEPQPVTPAPAEPQPTEIPPGAAPEASPPASAEQVAPAADPVETVQALEDQPPEQAPQPEPLPEEVPTVEKAEPPADLPPSPLTSKEAEADPASRETGPSPSARREEGRQVTETEGLLKETESTAPEQPAVPAAVPRSPQKQASSPIGVTFGDVYYSGPLALSQSFSILKATGVNRVKLFDHKLTELSALSAVYGTSALQVVVSISNAEIESAASASWASSFISELTPYKHIISHICIGNEVDTLDTVYPSVAAAITTLGDALSSAGFVAKPVTSLSYSVLANSSVPSAGQFRLDPTLPGILAALSAQGSPLFLSLSPYAHLIATPSEVSLPYALGTAPTPTLQDGDHAYYALFDAMYDSVVSALRHSGYPAMKLVVEQCGWPTAGDGSGFASVANARVFNSLMARKAIAGTPLAPGPYSLFLHEAFDEAGRGSGVEAHFGVWDASGAPKYRMDWNLLQAPPVVPTGPSRAASPVASDHPARQRTPGRPHPKGTPLRHLNITTRRGAASPKPAASTDGEDRP